MEIVIPRTASLPPGILPGWLLRADARLARRAAANAAVAVAEGRARQQRWRSEEIEAGPLLVPRQRVG